jgi:hypothetical protein
MLISRRPFIKDVYKKQTWFIGNSDGSINYSFFITSLGNYFITSDGKNFKVKT